MHYTHTGKHAHNTSTHPKDICRLFSIQWLGIVIPNKESRVKFVVLRWWVQSDAEKVSCCQPQQSVSIMPSRCRRPDVFTINCQDVWCTTAALVRALLNLTSCWIPFYILLLCPSVLESDFCYRPASSPRADFLMMWMCSALNAKMCAMDVKIPVEWLCVRCSNWHAW